MEKGAVSAFQLRWNWREGWSLLFNVNCHAWNFGIHYYLQPLSPFHSAIWCLILKSVGLWLSSEEASEGVNLCHTASNQTSDLNLGFADTVLLLVCIDISLHENWIKGSAPLNFMRLIVSNAAQRGPYRRGRTSRHQYNATLQHLYSDKNYDGTGSLNLSRWSNWSQWERMPCWH